LCLIKNKKNQPKGWFFFVFMNPILKTFFSALIAVSVFFVLYNFNIYEDGKELIVRHDDLKTQIITYSLISLSVALFYSILAEKFIKDK